MFLKIIRKFLIWLGLVNRPQYQSETSPHHPPPETLHEGKLVIVGGPGYQKWAFFRCPCKCQEIIMLSLMADRRPRWSVSVDKYDLPTIDPSIRRLDGCYSHFWIQKGQVTWCDDTGHPLESTWV